MSVTSTQGKLEVLRRNYEGLGKVRVNNNDWKEDIVSILEICSGLSEVSENDRLDRQREGKDTYHSVKLKTGACDGIVGELLQYGGSGMVCLLEQLLSVIWRGVNSEAEAGGTYC